MLFGCYGKNFGFYPVNIGKALKNFEQEINIYLFIFWEDFFFLIFLWKMRVERPIKDFTAVVEKG